MSKKPSKKKIILIIVLAVLLAAIAYFLYYFVILAKWEPKTDLRETSTKPVLYDTITDMKAKMGSNYPCALIMEQGIEKYTDEQLDETLLAVPGMEATKTITSKGKIAMCTSMTPQGIVACDDGFFISAYCHTHKHNSVIYYMDFEGKLISTITLSSKSHVGGLAYDPVNRVLWVSEKKNGETYLAALNISTIQAYSDKKGSKPIKYDQFVNLDGIKVASYVTYNEGAIWAGEFTYDEKGELREYQIRDKGILDGSSDYAIKTDENIQGLFIGDDYSIMSKSYGPFKSKILVFWIEDENLLGKAINNGAIPGEEDAVMIIENPPKLEQIGAYYNRVYFLYESAAFAYRSRGHSNIDRVLAYNNRSTEEWMEIYKNNSTYAEMDAKRIKVNEKAFEKMLDR